jgi:hypothetical protein
MTPRLAAAVAVLALGLVAGCSGHQADKRAVKPGPGPIEPVDRHVWTHTYPAGSTITDGLETITIRGHQPAVLDSVELVGAHGLRMVGVKLADQRRGVLFTSALGWPPRVPALPASLRPKYNPAAVVPAAGARLRPGASPSYELLIGMKVQHPGSVGRRGILIRYHVGDKHYAYVDHAAVWICTSKKYERHGSCPILD